MIHENNRKGFEHLDAEMKVERLKALTFPLDFGSVSIPQTPHQFHAG
jgi:hypothetical protein